MGVRITGLCLMLSLWLSACSSGALRLYEGAPRAASEIATLSMPEALEVARVNGVEVKGASGMLKSGDKQLELAPGRYELLIFYRQVWESSGEHDVLRSNPALFVLEARAGHRYRVGYELPQRYEQAKALATRFSGWIEDLGDNSRVASQPSGLKFKSSLLPSMAGNEELLPDTAPAGESARTVVAPLPVLLPTPTPTPAPATAATAASPGSTQYGELMRLWWKQASAEERRDFLRWAAAQP